MVYCKQFFAHGLSGLFFACQLSCGATLLGGSNGQLGAGEATAGVELPGGEAQAPNSNLPLLQDPPGDGNDLADPMAQPGDVSLLSCGAGLATTDLLRCDKHDHLVYAADPTSGAFVQDFSTAGYRGGGVRLPLLPIVATLAPSGGDDAAALQAALDAASKRAADANGWRGRVLLGPGTFRTSRTLTLSSGGVVLEGTASVGPQATTLALTGSATSLLTVVGTGTLAGKGAAAAVQNLPVPAGSRTVTLDDASGFKAGDAVLVSSYRNLAWLTLLWGGSYPPVRDGATQSAWGSSMTVRMSRQVAQVEGNVVTLDAPLGDALPEAKYGTPQGATVQLEAQTTWLREFGLGHIKLQGRYVPGTLGTRQLVGVSLNAAQDCWLDDIEATDFGFSTLVLGGNTRNVTVQDVRNVRTGVQDGGAKPFDFNLYGQKTLVQGCASQGNKTFYATHNTASAVGPNVVQNYRVRGTGTFEPHQRWSPGILFDNVYVPAGGIALKDRAGAGSGHGWGTGFSVVYNALAGTTSTDKAGMDALPGHTLGQPPSSANFGLGLVGPNRSDAAARARYLSPGKPVGPPSLWAHQLWQRLGPVALQTVVGPWQVKTVDGKLCLAATAAAAGAKLSASDCDAAGQRALFDITSRNAVRLGDSGLCVTAASAKAGAAVTLEPCRNDDLQHWETPSRGGFATVLGLRASGSGARATCLVPGDKAATVGGCASGLGPWRLLVSHLAR